MQPHPDDDDLIALLYPESLDPDTRAALEQRVLADDALVDRLAAWRATLNATRRASRLPEPPPGVRAHVLREARAHAEGRLRSRAAAAPESASKSWFAGFGSVVAGAFGVALAIGGAAVMSTDQAPEAALSPERVATAPAEPAEPADDKPAPIVAAASTQPTETRGGLSAGTVVGANNAAAPPPAADDRVVGGALRRASPAAVAQTANVESEAAPDPFPGARERTADDDLDTVATSGGARAEKAEARLAVKDAAGPVPPPAQAIFPTKKAASSSVDEGYAEVAAPAAAPAPAAPAAPAEEKAKAASSLVLARTARAERRLGEAARQYDAALARPAPGDAPRGVVLMEAAEVYAALGDEPRALALLQQSIAAGGPQVERASALLSALEGARREAARPRPVEDDGAGSEPSPARSKPPQSLPAGPLP